MTEQSKNVILFDGVCNLCNGAVNFIIDHDPQGTFHFASLQSDAGQELMRQHALLDTDLDSIILIKRYKTYVKSDAVLAISRQLKGGWRFIGYFGWVPRFIRDWVYDRVAANRYRLFGKTDQCRVPTPELKERFL